MLIHKNDVLLFLNPIFYENGEIKNKFNKWYEPIKIAQIRATTVLTALLYVLYSQINLSFIPSTIQPQMTLFHLYVLPFSLLFITALTFWEKSYRVVNILLAIAPVIAAIGNLLIIVNINEPSILLPELYLIVIWTFSISGLRLNYAVISASTIFLISSFAGYFFIFQHESLLINTLWLFSAFSFGLLNAFLIEKSHIQTFLNEYKFECIATIDGMTGLNNRSKSESIIVEEIQRSERYKRKLSVILLDIDYFKSVNDNYGHHVGDAVLKEFSSILKNSMRKVDEVGRWGGEEFLIILPETGIKEAASFAEHLRSKIEDHMFTVIDHKTASLGVAEYIQGDGPQSLINRADKALYKAKGNGRNQIQYFQEPAGFNNI